MINTHCQDQLSVKYPPIKGPAKGENIAATPKRLIAIPRCSFGKTSNKMA